MTRSAPTPGLLARGKAWWAWWLTARPARANARFGSAGGGVLTGGIAYSALFSVFAALTIGFTIFMAILGSNERLRQNVLDALSASLPGLVDTGDGQGLIQPSDLVLTVGLNVTGLVAVVVLVVSATGALAALRSALRAMFGVQGVAVNAVGGKLRELAGFAGLAVAVLLSAVGTIAVTGAAHWLLGLMGVSDGTGLVVRIAGLLVAFVVDAAIFAGMVVVLVGVRPARRDLLLGSVLAAVGIGAVRLLGTSVVAGSVGTNPLFASFAVLVTLLIWLNLLARIILLAAAWTANPNADPPQPDEFAVPR
ncbi:YihY/virulence factor BrkB family protein [Pengzhenrongella phosphoraccumulans]|uniref:YihY/virulence factor BrkB family protein n=1 Tax=Pengzhenrongella phosphoraccumulans TaxID=3114394 RepID=UPI003890F01A